MEKKKVKKILKVILIIIIILLAIFIIHTLRNFFIIKSIQNNIEPYLESKNFHIRSIATEETGAIITMNYYEKDGRKVTFLEKNDNEGIYKISMYNNGGRQDNFYDNEEGKTVQLNLEGQIWVNLYNYLETDNDWQTLIASVATKIKEIEYNEKPCYVINDFMSPMFMNGIEKNEVYIEKDTGLFLKSTMDSTITEREYEFDNVDDSIFLEPDISQYTLK